MNSPNRWLHLKHPSGFTPDQFLQFEAHCRVFQRYVNALYEEWTFLGNTSAPLPKYEFFPPALSADGKIATLPIGGEWNLGAASLFENHSSWILSQFLPLPWALELEEGLTENSFNEAGQAKTTWRKVYPTSANKGAAT